MRSNRIGRWTALLLAVAMLIALPAPAALAASAGDAQAALERTFSYYRIQRDGNLGGWEALAAALLAGEDPAKYALPSTDTGSPAMSVLIALMKGDMERARALAAALPGNLNNGDHITTDAMGLIAVEAYNRSAAASSGDYSPVVYDRDAAVNSLLAAEAQGGGFGFGDGGDPDTTGMVLAALALFNTDAYPAVRAAVARALAYLHGAQQSNGGFSAWGYNNANSVAAVIRGLCALREDMNDWRRNGKTPVDALLSFQTAQGGFGYTDALENDIAFATPQAVLALAQVASGKTFFTDLIANAVPYKSLSVGVADENGAYHERSVSVKDGETLSTALTRALRGSDAVDADAYHCHAAGALLPADDLSGLTDGAEILAIHKSFENVACFLTEPDDGFGVNTAEIPFGGSWESTLRIASASAIAGPALPLAGIGVDGDGDGSADATTDAEGKVTLGFIAAGAYDVHALPAGVPSDTVLLPARITVRPAEEKRVVSVRVEGSRENLLFDPAFPVGYAGSGPTVFDAILQALRANGIAYTLGDGGYITSINGEADPGAWLYGIAAEYRKGSAMLLPSHPVTDGDEIIVYHTNESYDTPFPLIDCKLNADGSVTVTIKAWKTDWTTNESDLLPVPGVSVSWAEYTAFAFAGLTDENGALTVPAANAPVGAHTLRIDKKSPAGLPDILRLAPGHTVNVTRESASSQAPEASTDRAYITVTGPSGSLFARMGFLWYGGVTPLALLGKTGLRHETDAAGEYVKAIGGIAEFDYGPNSGWLYRVNGVETIRESAAKYKLNAGDELEWFYTRDYTREAGSAAWSAAPAAEGAADVTLRPEAEAVNGAAAVRIADEDVKKAVAEALTGKADEIVIAPTVTGEARRISVTLSAASLRGIADDTDAKLTLRTALGDVSLAGEGLAALAARAAAEDGSLALSIEREADRVSALIALDGKAAERVEGGVKLRVPVPNASVGTVALRVREDGTEEIVLLSMAEADALVAILDGSASIRIEDKSRAFDDVGEGAWFKEDADFVSARGLFRGTAENAFSGEAAMTRAMLVAVLHRLAGSPAAAGNAFSDVADTAWYREAASWAAAGGIVRGMDGGFAGGGDITREQLAVTTMRLARALDVDMGDPADLADFTDRLAVSAWAEDGMRWAVGAGLLEGDAGRRLNAGAPAARAEVAAVTRRFVENWVKAL